MSVSWAGEARIAECFTTGWVVDESEPAAGGGVECELTADRHVHAPQVEHQLVVHENPDVVVASEREAGRCSMVVLKPDAYLAPGASAVRPVGSRFT